MRDSTVKFGALALAMLAGLSAWPSVSQADTPILPGSRHKHALRPPGEVTIAAVGDILFGRYDEDKTYLRVPQVADPFAEVAEVIGGADIGFCNIESPVIEEPPKKEFGVYKRMTFRAHPDDAKLVGAAGFDVASLANNHMFNMRAKAIGPTVLNVAAAGMRPGGAGATPAEARRPVVLDVNGARVVFLMFTVWNNTGKSGFTRDGSVAFFEYEAKLEQVAAAEVRAARRYLRADYVIVSIHWGIEYEPHPHSGQTRFAKVVKEAGADLLLGHHPHVVQDVKIERNFAVAYSMGNFMFDNPTLDRRESLIFLATLSSPGPLRHVSNVELEPIMIDRKKRVPTLARGKEGARWRKRLATLAPGIPIRPEAPLVAGDPPPLTTP